MNKLHPGALWVFRFRVYIIFILISFMFSQAFIWTLLMDHNFGYIPSYLLTPLIITLVAGEIYARLTYRFWQYEFTKDGVKLERGIIWKKYSSIPYERIQNIDIHRGVLARIFGFSSISIQTAGYSNPRSPYAEGNIPALDITQAEKIREFVVGKIKGTRRSGL